ncbi:hypothetical protein [Chitinophaga sancti]|uniref:Uncharacterized protein n=1 Tax=Chitinophaga sancti TaxID=1004 RepID=A0A1K1SYR1_9BACT|nr:hypothetical protein [Chitinophaga sancti]WQD63936.1 hypothetical protein U0033_05970 [Chitinophaga sancti]WQG90439.1 hypothetical protein SR876_02950 [Chitinophaga sancti]SFW89388.1 hypothetical protein SAMN05661012_06423 [Chitinophaga sancti]
MSFLTKFSSTKKTVSDQQKGGKEKMVRQKAAIYLQYVAWFFSIILILGIISSLLFTTTTSAFSTALMWILGVCLSGIAIGFLFGIPKILQANKSKEAEGNVENRETNGEYQLQVNTNLTEISDWLTKIIVGLGLVNLSKLPPYIYSVATLLADGVCFKEMGTALAFAYGLLICFSVSGFLFGYLVTRLFLTNAFSKADQEAIKKVIEEAVGGQVAIVSEGVASAKAQLANIENNQSILSQTLFPEDEQADGNNQQQAETTSSPTTNPETFGLKKEEALSRLLKMADDYLTISDPDWAERVNQKDKSANRMGEYALKHSIQKDDIANIIRTNGNEGLIIALATMIAMRPENRDLNILLDLGKLVSRLHVRYRVLVALGTLASKKLIPLDSKNHILTFIQKYKAGADTSLMEMINNTTSLVQSSL